MAKKVGQILGPLRFRDIFRDDAGQKVPADPETFSVKTQILLVNGPKDARTDDPLT